MKSDIMDKHFYLIENKVTACKNIESKWDGVQTISIVIMQIFTKTIG
jgi:hypothetical protein